MTSPHPRGLAAERRRLAALLDRLDSALLDPDPADADQLGQARHEIARQLNQLHNTFHRRRHHHTT